MKKIILLLLLSPFQSHSQKISGVVTYYFNQYQGDKPDIGAKVLIVDSLNIDTTLIHKIEMLQLANVYRNTDSGKHAKIKRFSQQQVSTISEFPLLWPLISNDDYFEKLNDTLMRKYVDLQHTRDAITCEVDGSGNYSMSVKPGSYYIFFESNGRKNIIGFQGVEIERGTVKPDEDLKVNEKFGLY